MILDGIGASSGVAIGKVFIKKQGTASVPNTKIDNVEAEIERFEAAKLEAINELKALYEKALSEVGEEHAGIFDVHQMLVQDLDFHDQVVNVITEEKYNAAYAVSEAAVIIAGMFESMEDAYMKERAADIRDISKRLIGILTGEREVSLADINEPVILVAKDLFPSDTIQMNKQFVLGFITEDGGKMSHSAILARTMQIPAIVGVKDALTKIKNEETVILDGKGGKIYLEPTQELLDTWKSEQDKYNNYKQELQKLIGTENKTLDGVHIEINANIGSPDDIAKVLENDTKGIGLFRSEFLYMDGTALPTEEMQYEAYKKVLEAMEDRVIIRTLDVGGDKELPYLNIPKEENPFLGHRAIRYCLDNRELFKKQIRAILRAAVYGYIKIMLPLITCIEEVNEAKAVIKECEAELAESGAEYKSVPVGIMVETPSAVFISDLLAQEVEFFSIGTNDLTGYTMAVDRGNSKVSKLYDAMQPSVLRAIEITIKSAKKAGIQVGMCGEAAADPRLIPKLIEWGLDEFSVTPSSILQTRKIICEYKA